MSELKAFVARKIDDGSCDHVPCIEVYPKSEADKVIEEKDAEIAELIEKNKRLANKDIIMASETIKDLYKELRHSNRKRCLAMADALTWEHDYLVDFVSDDFPNVRFKRRHRIKWVNRWLALAEEPTWAKFLQLIHKETK